jgi:hypothetical protein
MDEAQHSDEMCYRLLRGDTLMRKVLDPTFRSEKVRKKQF